MPEYQSQLTQLFPTLQVQFSSKRAGDMAADSATRQAWLAQFGWQPQHVSTVTQVHSSLIVPAASQATVEADGLWTAADDAPLMIKTADCAPVILYDPVANLVCLLHVGWRGAVAGIVQAGIAALVAAGAEPADVYLEIGPCLQVDSFEVQPDFVAEIQQVLSPALTFLVARNSQLFFDLPGFISGQAQAVGISPEQILTSQVCTASPNSDYFSYRADSQTPNRFATLVWQVRAVQ